MSPEAQKLAQALLDHHRKFCRVQSASLDSCLIAYGDLCEQVVVFLPKDASSQFEWPRKPSFSPGPPFFESPILG